MLFPASIRWRLQIWLGILLVGLLTAFGVTAWRLERTQRLRRLDDELEKQAALLGAAVRGPEPGGHHGPGGRGGHGPGSFRDRNAGKSRDGEAPEPPDGEGFRGPEPGFDEGEMIDDWLAGPPDFHEETLPDDVRDFFNKSSREGFYYVIWTGRSPEPKASELAPEAVPKPGRSDRTTQARFRDREGVREVYYFTELGDCILAGRPVTRDLAAMRPVAYTMLLTGLGVLALGLGGGWWLTLRSIRPIEDIATAARRISENNLSERIPSGVPGSELGALAEILNTTFARLEDSFSQQKRFTSDASHELRTPLTVLISEIQTTLSRERTPEEYREVLAGNLDTARQMKRLAEALLELARLDSGDTVRAIHFDLAAVATESASRLVSLAQARDIVLSLDLKPVEIEANPERLALLVTNLVDNAIHYGRRGGTVTLTSLALDGEAVLEVADDGIGISPDDLPHVFERFYRADRSRSRSGGRYGLGLAICKAMVQGDGGTISVASTLGEGSVFTVRYPLKAALNKADTEP